jgi:N utilization substance protein A
VVVPDEQLSLAIGRRGQNVRLASQLVGWNIDILTEAEESDRRSDEFRKLSQLFVDALNVEEVIAHLLVTEGFTTVEEVAYIPLEDLAAIEGFDEAVAQELRSRAETWIASRREELDAKLSELGVEEEMKTLPGMNQDLLLTLAEKGIKTRDDLGDLATEELLELLPANTLTVEQAGELIMSARAHWFEAEGEGSAA